MRKPLLGPPKSLIIILPQFPADLWTAQGAEGLCLPLPHTFRGNGGLCAELPGRLSVVEPLTQDIRLSR